MIELSLYSQRGHYIRSSLINTMCRVAKEELRKQGINIKVSRYPSGRGGGGTALLMRLLLLVLQSVNHVILSRGNKEFRNNQPVFEIYIRDTIKPDVGLMESSYVSDMDQLKEITHIGYMISNILETRYPNYGYSLLIGFNVPSFNYNIEIELRGKITASRVGLLLRFIPTELKSYVSETITVGESFFVRRTVTYFDNDNNMVSQITYYYLKFDRLHNLSRRKHNLQYKREDSYRVLYPKYFKAP